MHGEKFSLENIAPKYEQFFTNVSNIYSSSGWYDIKQPSLYTDEWLKAQGFAEVVDTTEVKKNLE